VIVAVELMLPGTPAHKTPADVCGVAANEFGVAIGDDVIRSTEGDIASGAEFSIVVGGGGLRPPGSSSDEPIGIPTRPTAASPPIPVGEDAVAAGLAMLPPAARQAPDAVPALMPASNSAVGSEIPVVRAAEPPQAELLPVIALCGTLPASAGLTPGDTSCVAPSGTPTGATGAPGPMPSGDVIPSGGSAGCAKAAVAPNSAVTANRTGKHLIAILHLGFHNCLPRVRADAPECSYARPR
jgi:hypothetical protein